MARNGSNGRWLKSWHFKDADPETDKFRTLWQDEGRLKFDDVAALAGLSTSTVKNMFGGKTRRPQHMTYTKLAHAFGHSYTLTRELTPNYEVEIPRAKTERKEYRMWFKKKKTTRKKGK